MLHKVAIGYYVVIPQDRIGTDWRPTVEAAAIGVDEIVLMGITAAPMHNVVPRALAVAIVAVPGSPPNTKTGAPTATTRAPSRQTSWPLPTPSSPPTPNYNAARAPHTGPDRNAADQHRYVAEARTGKHRWAVGPAIRVWLTVR